MLRILFCVSCCSAPPTNNKQRPPRAAEPATNKDGKLDGPIDFKGLPAGNEKEGLILTKGNDTNYGAKDGESSASTKRMSTTSNRSSLVCVDDRDSIEIGNGDDGDDDDDDDSGGLDIKRLQMQTDSGYSVRAAKLVRTSIRRQLATDEGDTIAGVGDIDLAEQSRYLFSQQSISPPSSIDIEQFRESPSVRPSSGEMISFEASPVVAPSTPGASFGQATQSFQQQVVGGGNASRWSERRYVGQSAASEMSAETVAFSSSSSTLRSSAQNIPSTTKIGEYARLEYSPVEDLDSLTAVSRGGSEKSRPQSGAGKGGQSISRPGSPTDATVGSSPTVAAKSTAASSNANSRKSSQGIESTSISIASQLSNEQFQQNLTNMLESATNSPTIPMFGPIGMPLGLPTNALDGATTETAKTSPETPGAALTSASQDSLSNGSSSPPTLTKMRPVQSVSRSISGGALVNDSIEQQNLENSPELAKLMQAPATADLDRQRQPERMESSLSMATTTTSSRLTNPTPTPSELSGGSQKKKSKLRAKSLFKKFKPGGKKDKKKEMDVNK